MAAPLPFMSNPNKIMKKQILERKSVKNGTIFDVFKKVSDGYGL